MIFEQHTAYRNGADIGGSTQMPTIATSISPSKGTVIFDTMEGKAICNICLSMGFIRDILFNGGKGTQKKQKIVGKINYISTFIY